VDADEMIDLLVKRAGAKPGAAAEVDRAFEEGWLLRLRAHRYHGLEKKLRRAIVEVAEQRGLEARRILIEQRLHITLRHLGELLGAKPHQLDRGAMAIPRIAC